MDERSESVIGGEVAAALEAERERIARTGGSPSPLPPAGDDPWSGQSGLLGIAPLSYDEALTAFALAYRASDEAERAALRDRIGLDDGYVLLAFARRCAVFGTRGGDMGPVEAGLAALAAIAYERVDQRDGLWVLALLHHAAERVGADPAAALSDAAAFGEPAFARMVEGFLARPASGRDLREAWGYAEVEGPCGLGLIGWGFEPWHPTVDLVRTGLDLAEALRGDDYVIEDPQLAVRLPAVWLDATGDPDLEPTLASSQAALLIRGRLRPEASEHFASQQLTTWLVELPDEGSAQKLAVLARSPRPGHALLGIAAGTLFALVVARSARVGVPAHETSERLHRFEAAVRGVLPG